jgi:uncharacterized protein Yka (UPF0111/DUF47 family)
MWKVGYKVNKELFIKTLATETSYDIDTCSKINEVIESHFIIGKNNKKKIIRELVNKLEIEEHEADNIYNKVMDILTREFKNKIRHPLN